MSEASAPAERPEIPRWVYVLVRGMDDAVPVPGTRFRLGWDAVLGFLVPGVGDALSAASHVVLLVFALRARVPAVVLARMVGNAGIDVATGLLPVLGDLFDVAFAANRKNLELLERASAAQARGERATTRSDYLIVGAALAAFAAIMVLPVLGVIALLAWLLGAR